MKKIIFMLLAVAALTSCSKFEPVSKGSDETGSQVKLSGSIYTGEATRLPGVIDGTLPLAPLTFSVYRADETGTIGALSWPATFTTTSVTGTLGTTAVAGNITTTPQLYYLPEAGRHSTFIGLHPENATGTAGKVKYTAINGGQDIMCTAPVVGDKTTIGDLSLSFYHLLTKIEVKLENGGGSPAEINEIRNRWGEISSIAIVDKLVDVEVTLPLPNTTDHGSAAIDPTSPTPAPLPLVNPDGSAIATPVHLPTTSTAATFGYAMFVPVTSDATLTLNIATELGGEQPVVTDQLQKYEAGIGYVITVTFNLTSAAVTSVSTAGSINPWGSGTPRTGDL
jgi:hypothetical protein